MNYSQILSVLTNGETLILLVSYSIDNEYQMVIAFC